MIQVDERVEAALRAQSAVIRPRVTWEQGNLSGTPVNSIDVSDRLVSFPGCAASLGAYLSGVTTTRETLVLDNHDRRFSPGVAGGYFDANRGPAERLMARVRVEIGVRLSDGSFGYVPVYAGFVEAHVCPPGTVELDLVSPMAMLRRITLPEDIVLDPTVDTPASVIRSLLADNTALDTSAHFDWTFDTLDTLYHDLDWIVGGRIRAGTTIAGAAETMARSGCATVLPAEDGTLRLVSELPEQFAGRHDHYGDLIDSSRAADWNVVEAADIACTAVEVAYNGVSIRYPNTAHAAEPNVGRLHRMVAAPYIWLGRTAWIVAYTLYTQHDVDNAPLAISWSMGLEGLLIQLGDRARVKPQQMDAEHAVRIVAKAVGSGRVFFTGVVDGHEASLVQGAFGTWGSTTWGDATEVLF